MKIDQEMLDKQTADFVRSPNNSGSFDESLPDTIVIHYTYTAGSSAESSVTSLTNPNAKASAHLVIGRDGFITQLVPFDTIAWHAGESAWGDQRRLNKYSIGIELDNMDPGPAFPLDKMRDKLLHADRSDQEEDTEDFEYPGVVTASLLNIHSGPSDHNKKIANPLHKGTAVEVLDKFNGWYQVEVKLKGWVASSYVVKKS